MMEILFRVEVYIGKRGDYGTMKRGNFSKRPGIFLRFNICAWERNTCTRCVNSRTTPRRPE